MLLWNQRKNIAISAWNGTMCRLCLRLVCVCLLTAAGRAVAQPPRLYSFEQGLRSSNISSMFVDRDNFVWVSTMEALELFDGYRFHNIDCTNRQVGTPFFNEVHQIQQLDANRYWLMTNSGLFIFNNKTSEFEPVPLREDEAQTSLSVTQLLRYPKPGYMIVPSEGYGTYVLNERTLKVDRKLTQQLENLLQNAYVAEMLVDWKNRIWSFGLDHQLLVVDVRRNVRLPLHVTPGAADILRSGMLMSFLEDKPKGRILMGMSRGGVLVYDDATRTLREARGNRSGLFVMSLLRTRAGRLLVGTDNQGLYEMDPETEQLTPVEVGVENVDMRYAKVHMLVEDADGNVIAGLYQRGLLVLPQKVGGFSYTALSPEMNGKNASCVTSFARSRDGMLWTGTDGSALFRSRDGSQPQCVYAGLSSPLVQAVATDRQGRVWCGMWRGGVQVGDDHSFSTPDFLRELATKSVMCLVYDGRDDVIYAGTNGDGVYRIDPARQQVWHIVDGEADFAWVNSLALDSDHQLWISDAADNFCYDIRTGKAVQVRKGSRMLQRAQAFAQFGNYMLLGDNYGLHAVNRRTKKIVDLPWLSAARGQQVKSIQPAGGLVWFASDRGIVCLDSKTGKQKVFHSFDGYSVGEFHRAASLALPDGRLLFGGDNGMVTFSPAAVLQQSPRMKRVRLTGLQVGNTEVTYVADRDSDNVLDASILTATEARFRRGDNAFRIHFSAPEMGEPDRVNYTYILEGYEENWHTTAASNPQAFYARLSPGTYTFRVRAHFEDAPTDRHGAVEQGYSETSLRIVVPHPWYAMWWAYVLYALLAIAIGYYIFRNVKARQRARARLRESMHKEQMKEAQLRLFTSIAHELRSPLTMILSPLKLLMNGVSDESRLSNYHIMERNCNRLLKVVNQITDVRKISNGQFRLHFQETDFLPYANDIMSSFMGLAVVKNIAFTSEWEDTQVKVWIDPLHFEKILTNLLSNAFKFTPKGGRIIVRTICRRNEVEGQRFLDDQRVEECLEMKVYNSGSHIDEHDLTRIYERFYQSSSAQGTTGSGIGLNLAYELVRLHHGTIEVHNVEPDGVEFIVRIPMGNAHLTPAELNEEAAPAPAPVTTEGGGSDAAQPQTEADLETEADRNAERVEPFVADNNTDGQKELKERASVLLVDDDEELLDYLKTQLRDDYHVTTATSGNKAWAEVLAVRPDVVVTDIRMPDGDGYGLCRRIKGNPETDHIAIIMLTSEQGEDSRQKSLDLEVEHFLPKPFNILMLKSALTQVLKVRDSIRNRMRRTEIGHNYSAMTVESGEEKLIKRVHDVVMQHIDESEFSVEQLSAEVGISRVHLNRRLKQLYGITPSAYMRSVRLKQAAYLLVNNKLAVSDVAYRVGFSSPSYFSSNFHEFFGMAPKEFVAYYSDNMNEEALRELLK